MMKINNKQNELREVVSKTLKGGVTYPLLREVVRKKLEVSYE